MHKLLCGAILVAACAASALDLTTNDGTVYKNVSISSVTPIGFDVCYTPNGGGLAIKEILFSNLSEEWRKKYNYDPKAAEEFNKKVEQFRKTKAEEMRKQYKDWVARQEEEDHLQSAIYAGRLNVQLKVLRATSFGCVAYADSMFDTLTSGHFGKVAIMGMRMDNGNAWAGNIYPAGYSLTVSEGTLPVYTTSLEQAVMLARSNQYTKNNQAESGK